MKDKRYDDLVKNIHIFVVLRKHLEIYKKLRELIKVTQQVYKNNSNTSLTVEEKENHELSLRKEQERIVEKILWDLEILKNATSEK